MRERPTHGGHGLVAVYGTAMSARYDFGPVFAIRREHSVKSGEIQPRSGDQGCQAGDKVQRFQHHMGRAVPERLLVAVHDPAPAIDGEALGGDRRAGDVAAQAFQAVTLVRLADGGGMQ